MTELTNWLDEELNSVQSPSPYEKRPALKMQPNKIVEMEIDFSKPFYKWEDKIHKSFKAVIPITVNGEKLHFWVNTRNPLYREICQKGKAGITKLKIIQTGSQQDTRYNLVD